MVGLFGLVLSVCMLACMPACLPACVPGCRFKRFMGALGTESSMVLGGIPPIVLAAHCKQLHIVEWLITSKYVDKSLDESEIEFLQVGKSVGHEFNCNAHSGRCRCLVVIVVVVIGSSVWCLLCQFVVLLCFVATCVPCHPACLLYTSPSPRDRG